MEIEAAPWRELRRLIEEGDRTRLQAFLDNLAPLDVALAVSRRDDDHRAGLLAAALLSRLVG